MCVHYEFTCQTFIYATMSSTISFGTAVKTALDVISQLLYAAAWMMLVCCVILVVPM